MIIIDRRNVSQKNNYYYYIASTVANTWGPMRLWCYNIRHNINFNTGISPLKGGVLFIIRPTFILTIPVTSVKKAAVSKAKPDPVKKCPIVGWLVTLWWAVRIDLVTRWHSADKWATRPVSQWRHWGRVTSSTGEWAGRTRSSAERCSHSQRSSLCSCKASA